MCVAVEFTTIRWYRFFICQDFSAFQTSVCRFSCEELCDVPRLQKLLAHAACAKCASLAAAIRSRSSSAAYEQGHNYREDEMYEHFADNGFGHVLNGLCIVTTANSC
jgi:hypothetical protein